MKKYQLNSLDFVINRFFMKLFKTSNIRIVQLCQELFHFELPSVQLAPLLVVENYFHFFRYVLA